MFLFLFFLLSRKYNRFKTHNKMSHLGLKLESEHLSTDGEEPSVKVENSNVDPVHLQQKEEELSVKVENPNTAPIGIKQLFDKISPLDLIYFKGAEIVSELIMTISKLTTGEGGYSHVGLVVNRDLLPSVEELEPGRWYIWEAILSSSYIYGTDGILDIETGKGFFGSQIRDLEDVILAHTAGDALSADVGGAVGAGAGEGVGGGRMFSKKIAWGELKNNPWNQGKAAQNRLRRIFYKLHKTYYHTPYDANPVSCFGAPFKCLRPVRNLSDRLLYNVDYVSYIDNEIAELDSMSKTDLELDTTEPSGGFDSQTQNAEGSITDGIMIVDEGTQTQNAESSLTDGLIIVDESKVEELETQKEKIDLVSVDTVIVKSDEINFSRREGTIRTIHMSRDATAQDLLKIMSRAKKNNKNMKAKVGNFDPSKIPLMCSELISLFFILAGIIDKKFDPRDVLPVDLYSGKDIDGLMPITYWPRPIE